MNACLVSHAVVVTGTASCADNGWGTETRPGGGASVLLCLTLCCCYRYGKLCRQRVGGGDTCTGRGQCVAHAECSSPVRGKCVCEDDYFQLHGGEA